MTARLSTRREFPQFLVDLGRQPAPCPRELCKRRLDAESVSHSGEPGQLADRRGSMHPSLEPPQRLGGILGQPGLEDHLAKP